MTNKELAQVGAALYACEGTVARRDYRGENRYNYAIEITNSKPQIIATFCLFLKKVMKIDWNRVKGQLFVYPDHNQKKLVKFWSKVSTIPVSHFQKVILLQQKGSKYKPNPLGTFKVRYSSKEDFLKLQCIIEQVWKDVGVT